MSYMFYGTRSFNQQLNYKIINSTNYVYYMFYNATSFNHKNIYNWTINEYVNKDVMYGKQTICEYIYELNFLPVFIIKQYRLFTRNNI